jgi:hypothetical protein
MLNEVGTYYIFNRGYVDYTRLYRITKLVIWSKSQKESEV